MNTRFAVNDIYPTVQGEGCLTGLAMVLLRLHGCPVGCPWCDTKHTWGAIGGRDDSAVDTIGDALGATPAYVRLTADDIAMYIRRRWTGPKWVLVTGGEPALQDLTPLVDALHGRGFNVALETSGTAIGHVGAGFDWVCVSPKVNMNDAFPVCADAVEVADEIKYPVGRQRDIDVLDILLATIPTKESVEICLQPISMSKKATALCLETVQARGWRLSIQTHKLLGVA